MKLFKKVTDTEISGTDVFEYAKCPAFFKQYMSSGKKLEECYEDYYHNIIFQAGKDYEMKEVEKLYLVESTKSLSEALYDENISIIKINPEIILKREFPFLYNNSKKINKIDAIGKPDLLIRNHKTNKFIPLEYKTSLRFFNSIRFQLFHYCYLLQGYDSTIPYLGALKPKNIDTITFDLHELKSNWEKLVNNIFTIKLGIGSIRKIRREDINWTKECIFCVFRDTCKKIVKSDLKIRDLPEVRDRRFQMITDLGVESVQELAKIDPKAMWKKFLTIPNGKSVFNRELAVRQIIGTAKAFLDNQVIILPDKLDPINLNTKDAFFDTEYKASRTDPIIFSISLGFFKNDRSLQIKTWFADKESKVKTIVSNFYNYIIDQRIERVFGWGITSGDIPQLKKILPLPTKINFYDLYYIIKENVAMPVLSYRLKSVSEFLFGNQFKDDIRIGLAVIDLYEKYRETEEVQYREKIIEYNKKDVLQVYEIAHWYENLCKDYKS